jgi:hypothetical protein
MSSESRKSIVFGKQETGSFCNHPEPLVRTKNSVLTELVEFRQPSLYLFGDMLTIILSLFSSASQVF